MAQMRAIVSSQFSCECVCACVLVFVVFSFIFLVVVVRSTSQLNRRLFLSLSPCMRMHVCVCVSLFDISTFTALRFAIKDVCVRIHSMLLLLYVRSSYSFTLGIFVFLFSFSLRISHRFVSNKKYLCGRARAHVRVQRVHTYAHTHQHTHSRFSSRTRYGCATILFAMVFLFTFSTIFSYPTFNTRRKILFLFDRATDFDDGIWWCFTQKEIIPFSQFCFLNSIWIWLRIRIQHRFTIEANTRLNRLRSCGRLWMAHLRMRRSQFIWFLCALALSHRHAYTHTYSHTRGGWTGTGGFHWTLSLHGLDDGRMCVRVLWFCLCWSRIHISTIQSTFRNKKYRHRPVTSPNRIHVGWALIRESHVGLCICVCIWCVCNRQ